MEGGHSAARLHHCEEHNLTATGEIAGGVVSNSFVAPAAPVVAGYFGFCLRRGSSHQGHLPVLTSNPCRSYQKW